MPCGAQTSITASPPVSRNSKRSTKRRSKSPVKPFRVVWGLCAFRGTIQRSYQKLQRYSGALTYNGNECGELRKKCSNCEVVISNKLSLWRFRLLIEVQRTARMKVTKHNGMRLHSRFRVILDIVSESVCMNKMNNLLITRLTSWFPHNLTEILHNLLYL